MIPLAALAIAAGCLPVEAPEDRITAADLARALPEWRQVAPGEAIGLAPVPGVVRILRVAELRRLATRFNLAPDAPSDLCFQRPVAAIPPERMLAVMRRRLPEARIEILESSRVPAPAGELDFPPAGLRPGYWFGHVTYGAGHKFVVWARVDVKVPIQRITASADLKPGEPIQPAQLRIETRDEVPSSRPDPGPSLDDLAGRLPRRPIRAGTVVRKEWLDAPKLVQKGEMVKVEVVRGGAKLEAEGLAESSGALGEIISVQNLNSKRRFRARVESPGRVSVTGSL
jgi:flagellar basal body P-ring formation protein FlgA